MGISSAINNAVNGLKTNQQQSALVAQNIANASTPGYTTKTLSVQNYQTPDGIAGLLGVVQRLVNQEVQNQFNSSTSQTNYLSTQNTYATSIDQLFGTPGSTNTLQGALGAFQTALSTLQASPSNQSAQQGAVSAAQTVAQAFNQVSSSIQQLRSQADAQISDAVGQVNTLTKTISDLNNQIVSGQAAGNDITNLQDQRDLAVTQLSQYVDVNTRTDLTGAMNVFTSAGMQLVGASATQLSFSPSGVLSASANGAVITTGTGANSIDVIATGQIRSGSLAALVNQRDTVLPKAQNQLDDLAATIASSFSDTTTKGTTVTSGSQSGQSVDLTGLQYGNPVNLTYVDSTGATKKLMLVPVNGAGNLPVPKTLSNDPTVNVVGFDASSGNIATNAANALQTALGASFTVTNPSGNTLQVLNSGSGSASVTALSATVTQTQVQAGTATLPLFTYGSTGTPYTGAYTGGKAQKTGFSSVISINPAVLATPALMTQMSTSTQAGDPTRPTAMLTNFTNAQGTFGPETGIVGGNGTFQATITGFANQITSYWGAQSQNATSALNTQQVIQNNLQSQVTSTSSVNMDTQLSQLVQIQAAYQANARVMTVAQSMLTTLMQIQV
jgi:flagellar hook-associated protein 1 FlgK